MKLIIDFDDTIFDTERFKKEKLFPALTQYGVSKKVFEISYKKYYKKNTTYDVYKHLELLEKKFTIKIDKALFSLQISKNLHTFIFPEYIRIFEKCGKDNIYIITQGEKEFQKLKIYSSLIQKKVKKILIVDDSKQNELERLCSLWSAELIIFIDDKFKNLSFENKSTNLRRIFIGKKTNLTKKQEKYLLIKEIPIYTRKNIEKAIHLLK